MDFARFLVLMQMHALNLYWHSPSGALCINMMLIYRDYQNRKSYLFCGLILHEA